METLGRIAFIGGGNMAEALIKGLLEENFPADRMVVAEPDAERRRILEQRYDIALTENNRAAVEDSDLVVLAVKPQLAAEVLEGLGTAVGAERLLVSILAGVPTATVEGHLKGSPRVVRAMPNTPALIGEGATALSPGRHAGSGDLQTARRLFEAVGGVEVVTEAQMDAVTAVSGSGPAYVFTVIEALADGGVQEGLPRETARALAVQTVLGAARLVRETGEHPARLRDQVCSPGGTTIAAVKVLEEKGLRAALMEAVGTAARRSRELGGKK